MNPLYYIRLIMGIALLTSAATAENFPYAENTFKNNKLQLWTLERVRTYRDKTIGEFDDKDSVMIKDGAANLFLLGHWSKKVEGISEKKALEDKEKGIKDGLQPVIFETELDLTDINGLVYVALHVDDIATLSVTEINDAGTAIGTTIPYEVKGTALWRVDRSYKEFPTPIPAGRKYALKLNYQNTANLTEKYGSTFDFDGVNVFLMHKPAFDLAIASYGNEENLPEDRQPDGNPAPTPHEMDPGATVIAPIAGSDGENITPGKRARLTLTCDGSQPTDGTYTLSADPSLTKLKIYDKEEGGEPLTLPKEWKTKDFSSANKTYYVGSESFKPGDKIEAGTLTLTYERPLLAEGAGDELQDQVKVTLTPIEVIELSPLVKDEDGNAIVGSKKPVSFPKYNELVEEITLKDQVEQNRIAHREMKVRILGGKMLAEKKVTWTMKAWGVNDADAVRGDWNLSKIAEHKNRFEESKTYGKYGYKLNDQESSETKIEAVGNDGFTAIRVNLPPIGWNHAEVMIKIEGTDAEASIIRFIVPAVIVIDPGHGGSENIGENDTDGEGLLLGASSYNNAKGGWGKKFKNYAGATGILEKKLTLEYGLKLQELLRAKRDEDKLSLRIYMTRVTDDNLGGYVRARLARDKGADTFFSIHFNSASNKSARGAEMVVRKNGNSNLKEDRTFANRFPDKVAAALLDHDTTARKTARGPSIQSNSMTSDILGFYQDTEYHPIRATMAEVEFIHGEGGDKLINGAATEAAVKQSVVEALRDGLLEELNEFKTQDD